MDGSVSDPQGLTPSRLSRLSPRRAAVRKCSCLGSRANATAGRRARAFDPGVAVRFAFAGRPPDLAERHGEGPDAAVPGRSLPIKFKVHGPRSPGHRSFATSLGAGTPAGVTGAARKEIKTPTLSPAFPAKPNPRAYPEGRREPGPSPAAARPPPARSRTASPRARPRGSASGNAGRRHGASGKADGRSARGKNRVDLRRDRA
jgi:hypothetical protein